MWRAHGARHDAERCEWASDAETRACLDLAVLTPALGHHERQAVIDVDNPKVVIISVIGHWILQ